MAEKLHLRSFSPIQHIQTTMSWYGSKESTIAIYNRASELGACSTSETRPARGQRTAHFAASVANTAQRIAVACQSCHQFCRLNTPLFHLAK